MHAMSSARRDKLRVLQEREAAKLRMGRLQMMLQQKLVHKYGSKRNPNSKLNKEIEDAVKAFTFTARSSRQPTDDEFLELENTVRELRAKYCSGSSVAGRTGSAANSEREGGTREGSDSTRVSNFERRDSGGCCRSRKNHSSGAGGDADGDCVRESHRVKSAACDAGNFVAESTGKEHNSGVDGETEGRYSGEGLPPSIARAWRTFDVAKQIEYETKEQQKAENARLEKIRFREELVVHRAEKARQKAEQEEERRRHMEDQQKRLADFHLEQEEIKKRAADRHAEEKTLREEQVTRLQAEKEAERQARLEREMRDIETCKAQLQGEITAAERKRKMEKDRLACIQDENARQKEIRAQKQRESDQADAKLLREHRLRMDEEERKRAENLQQRMKRYEDIGSFWIERGAGKERADVAKREEQLTLKAARRKEEADLERERKEAENRRLATIAMASENKRVIAEKNALNQKRNQEELEFAQRFINDSEAFRQEEKDKIAKKKAAMASYRKDLEKQVEEVKARRQHEDMSETEFRLNIDLVKKLEADKKMVAQVRQRMENTH